MTQALRNEAAADFAPEDLWIPSVCRVCSNCCGIAVHRRDGVVVKIAGLAGSPHNDGKLCAKGQAAIMSLYDPARPQKPLIRTNPQKGVGVDPEWREASWEEALDLVTARLANVMADDPRKFVILRGVGEPDWVGTCVDAFAKSFGTPNFAGGPFFATHVDACYLINGTMHVEIDVPRCRYLLLFGAQRGGAVNHDAMRAAKDIAEARMRGMKLVVIDPICSPMASKADEWVPIRPGTDGALALSMIHVLINELGVYDRSFLRTQTNAAYLVGADGHYARDRETGKPLVWDEPTGCPCPFDESATSALLGEFALDGKSCEPAFVKQPIILLTDLLDATQYPATDLLDLYLARWSIERVFQQITEVFHLQTLIGTTPQGTVFQFAFCLLLYNLVQVVRAYVATAQARPVPTISTELLFDDVHRQLVAFTELVPTEQVEPLFPVLPTEAELRAQLTQLLATIWTKRWLKQPTRKRKAPAPRTPIRGNQTSVFRLVSTYHKQRVNHSLK